MTQMRPSEGLKMVGFCEKWSRVHHVITRAARVLAGLPRVGKPASTRPARPARSLRDMYYLNINQ